MGLSSTAAGLSSAKRFGQQPPKHLYDDSSFERLVLLARRGPQKPRRYSLRLQFARGLRKRMSLEPRRTAGNLDTTSKIS